MLRMFQWVKTKIYPGAQASTTPVQPNVPAMMTAPKQNTAEPSCTAEPETSAVHQGIDKFSPG